jgi:hypothetical protein
MGVRVTPEQFVEKHARNTTNAIQDYSAGVERVSVAPGVLAAAKQDKMLKGVQAAVQSGKWAQRVKSVTLDDWKGAAKGKGAARISDGVAGAAAKVRKFAEQFLPVVAATQAKIAAMPDLTLQDSIARMTTNVTELAKFSFKP